MVLHRCAVKMAKNLISYLKILIPHLKFLSSLIDCSKDLDCFFIKGVPLKNFRLLLYIEITDQAIKPQLSYCGDDRQKSKKNPILSIAWNPIHLYKLLAPIYSDIDPE